MLVDYTGHTATEAGGTCVGGLYGAHCDRGRWDMLVDYMGHIATEVGGICVSGLCGTHCDRGRWDMCRWTICETLRL